MRHTILVLVENKFGVLARVAGLFSARGYNIDSLTVGETEDPMVSRMTIVVKGDDRVLDQVKKQLNKLIDIITVRDLKNDDHIDRELMLFKVGFNQKNKAQLANSIKKSGGLILHTSPKSFLVQMVGPYGKIEALLKNMSEYGIKDLTRTGRVAITKD
ncbi:MAG: acetolactate synthase small subunit [Candidatus Omnitrophica bacterium CG12_big_fil_rev_8_21_14_0_65_43_15]|uniref:Acetolactate synthase small subunit n=1 Tax=Candidatus Taenaricola geysiri TaxID=1974752 RepID=A0A2J0LFF2_9BACT|nr:MAG: acetolactate synthase small subunit [Candidatus Omnitrophica bacterium CG12_big_fil_rev_8_21_14_0_65_43_15]PIY84765.1 MAG: acetolactate synthase small subunit [Candidatus Omnitrophica bacterium CG_4_10_14_0_8_um_filter_43_18]PJC46796.1 MAG: acetolactate synthase small subunit [Candidatus Omnitrophica bacterium CG_4_9_14_0_2_um_filter_43_12]